ncbi:MAG: hypothetical protein AVDCRST_MAG57-2478, partial [uncultured Blastococcus sp.]
GEQHRVRRAACDAPDARCGPRPPRASVDPPAGGPNLRFGRGCFFVRRRARGERRPDPLPDLPPGPSRRHRRGARPAPGGHAVGRRLGVPLRAVPDVLDPRRPRAAGDLHPRRRPHRRRRGDPALRRRGRAAPRGVRGAGRPHARRPVAAGVAGRGLRAAASRRRGTGGGPGDPPPVRAGGRPPDRRVHRRGHRRAGPGGHAV